MRALSPLVLVAHVLAAGVACAPPVVVLDAGRPPQDGGGGGEDAGAPRDAGSSDAGSDAGSSDAGAEDAGPADAGPRVEEGQACLHGGPIPCAEGLHCLRESALVDVGVCTRSCAAAGGGEDATLCGPGSTCQTVTTPILNVLGVVCLPPVDERDATCLAARDPDACTGELSCEIAFSEDVGGVLFVDPPRCKLPCDLDVADPDAACPAGESCLPARADPLAAAEGRGVCGTPVPLWDGAPVPPPSSVCDEITGHAYCDGRILEGLSAPPVLECLTGLYLDENDGLCTALCARPPFDYDGDGFLDGLGDEGPLSLQCPTGTACTQDLARDYGLVTPASPEVACDDFECPPGEPCAACPAGSECWFDPFAGAAKCAVVFGFCAPTDAATDAGPLDDGGADAGAVDGGSGEADGDAGALDGG